MASGWGSIVKGKRPGTWYLRFPLPPVDGKRKQGFETVRGTKSDAQRRLAELRLVHDSENPTRRMTVRQCWELHYLPRHVSRLAPSTQRGYLSAWRSRIEPEFGSLALEGVTRRKIQAWLDGMSRGAARGALAVLRAFYTFAVEEELTAHDDTKRRYRLPEAPAKKRTSDAVHDEAALVSIFQQAQGELWEAAFILSAFGGLRRTEAFGAKWEDIDFCTGYAVVHVQRGVQFLAKEPQVVPLKTAGSRREAVIPEPYASRLESIAWERIGDTWVSEPYGAPPNPDAAVHAYMRWHVGKAIRYVPWKNLRNSYATMLHARGIDLATVARLLGHTTPTTTYRHYDRPSAEQLARSVSVLGSKTPPGGLSAPGGKQESTAGGKEESLGKSNQEGVKAPAVIISLPQRSLVQPRCTELHAKMGEGGENRTETDGNARN